MAWPNLFRAAHLPSPQWAQRGVEYRRSVQRRATAACIIWATSI